MEWLWISLASLAGLVVMGFLLLLVVGASAQRGGFGLSLMQGLNRLLLSFGPTRRLALRASERALRKAGELPPEMLRARGVDPQTARQASDMLASMSPKAREDLMRMSAKLDRDDLAPAERQEALKEASDVILSDLPLSREQRRRAERMQGKAARAGQGQKRSGKKRKKRR